MESGLCGLLSARALVVVVRIKGKLEWMFRQEEVLLQRRQEQGQVMGQCMSVLRLENVRVVLMML